MSRNREKNPTCLMFLLASACTKSQFRVGKSFPIFLIIIWPCLKRTGNKQIQEFDVVLEVVGVRGVKLANFSLTGPQKPGSYSQVFTA